MRKISSSQENLALYRLAVASSELSADFGAARAVDGLSVTRWSPSLAMRQIRGFSSTLETCMPCPILWCFGVSFIPAVTSSKEKCSKQMNGLHLQCPWAQLYYFDLTFHNPPLHVGCELWAKVQGIFDFGSSRCAPWSQGQRWICRCDVDMSDVCMHV